MSLDQASPSEALPVETLSMIEHTKTQVFCRAIDLGTLELNTMVKDIGHVIVNF